MSIRLPDDTGYWFNKINRNHKLNILETTINDTERDLSIPQFFEEVKRNNIPYTTHVIRTANSNQQSMEDLVTGISDLYFTTRGFNFELDIDYEEWSSVDLLRNSKLGNMLVGFEKMFIERNRGREKLCTVWLLLNMTPFYMLPSYDENAFRWNSLVSGIYFKMHMEQKYGFFKY